MYVPTKEDLHKKTNTLLLLHPDLQNLILDCQASIPRIHDGTEQKVVTDKMIFLSAILYFFFGDDMKLSPFQIAPGHHLCIEAITFNRNDRFTTCSNSDDSSKAKAWSGSNPKAWSGSKQKAWSGFTPKAWSGSKRKADSSLDSSTNDPLDSSTSDQSCLHTFIRCMEKLLRPHTDLHNCDKTISRSLIAVFKRRTKEGYLYTDIGYSRSEVLNSAERIYSLVKTKKKIIELLKNPSVFGLSRTSMNPINHIRNQYGVNNKPLLLPQLRMVDTHINPTFAFQGVMNNILMVQQQFELDFLALISYLCALDFSGHNPYYFITASVLYLNHWCENDQDRDKTFGQGFYFGWKFLNFQRQVYYYENTHPDERGHKPPAGLHNSYHRAVLNLGMSDISYTLDEFIALCTSRMLVVNYCWIHLHNSNTFTTEPNEIEYQYNLLLSFFEKCARKSGRLISGNIMMVWSWLGLIIPEFGRYRPLPDEKNSNIVGISNHYGHSDRNSKSINHTTCKSVLATVCSAVKCIADDEGIVVTDAMVEHATCKIVREVNNSNSRDKFKAWMLKKQTMILFCNNDVIKFYQKNGEVDKSQTLHQSSLYRFWKKGFSSRNQKKTLNYFVSSLKKFTPEFVHHRDCKTEST